MSYLVLARKHRPQTFNEVVEQAHVTTTLKNSISSNRVAHAILFAGPRGTGKTTIARIMAKAMNCAEGPAPEPCNQCTSCIEVTAGKSVDVLEIDGASNNGVEQIRELCENSKYMPAHSRFKIYIIDEVHMLSISAFNALLKTLEEPPSHVMFLFATTEPHKIPITILSRCQRYDLKRISIKSIVGHMANLCNQNNIDIDEKTLEIIAREGTGSMRDSLSLLDQVISCSKESISYDYVLDILGIIDRKILFSLSKAILYGKTANSINILNDLYMRGYEIKKFYMSFLEHFRNLLLISAGSSQAVDASSLEIEDMTEIIKGKSQESLNQILDILFKHEPTIRMSYHPKICFEMILINLTQTKPLLSFEMLIEKLDDLKKNFSSKKTFYEEPEAKPDAESDAKPEAEKYGIISLEDSDDIEAAYLETDTENENAFEDEPIDLTDKNAVLKRMLAIISKNRLGLSSYLKNSKISEISDNGKITLKISGPKFNIDTIMQKKNIEYISNVLSDIFKKKIEAIIIPEAENSGNKHSTKIEEEKLKAYVLNHPLTEEAIKIFKGNLLEIKSITQ
jgi:DNA polymerase III subunit gamma/tau